MVRSSTLPSLDSDSPGGDAAQAGGTRVAVLVVTGDDELWTRLASAVPGLDAHQFDNVAELCGNWNPARAAVVLIDARGTTPLGVPVERVLTHGGALVPVALVDEQHRSAAAALERKRSLFDHIRVPLDAGTARTVVDRAAEEALARLALTAGDAGVGAGSKRRKSRPGLPLVGWIAAGLGLLAVAAAVFFMNSPGPSEEAAPAVASTSAAQPAAAPGAAAAPAATTTGLSPVEVEAMLDGARIAMRDKRYIDPPADSALTRYKAVLDVDPNNGEARQGLDRIAELLLARAATAISARDYSTALRALEVARSLKPDHPRLAALDAQLGERMHDLSLTQIQAALQANAFARATTLIQQAERAGNIPAAQLETLKADVARREAVADLANLARLAQARIAQGRLLEPADDSAKRYLQQLAARGGYPADELAKLNDGYVRRLLVEARAALARGASADFEAWAVELKANGVPAAQIASLQRDADKSREQSRGTDQQRLAQQVRDRIASHRLIAPESDSALHYYRALLAADGANAALPALKDALVTALLEQTRTASIAGDAAGTQAAADAARDLGAPFAQIAAAQAAGGAAAHGAMATPPRLLKSLAPLYPDRAAAAGTEGWVDVDFTVSVKGLAEDPHVVEASPTGVFDQAALNAVRKARFEPAKAADGAPLPVTSRMRVRFALKGS
jgi:TonB family protein